jgi:hypothetical protein
MAYPRFIIAPRAAARGQAATPGLTSLYRTLTGGNPAEHLEDAGRRPSFMSITASSGGP